MQGIRHRVPPGDADRHVHGVTGRCLRGVLQLRPDEPPAGPRGSAGEIMTSGRMNQDTTSGEQTGAPDPAGWVDEALREHAETERLEAAPPGPPRGPPPHNTTPHYRRPHR